MDRLTEVSLGGVRTGFSTYDALGRMTAKGAGGRSVFSNPVYNLTSQAPRSGQGGQGQDGIRQDQVLRGRHLHILMPVSLSDLKDPVIDY